MRFSWLSMRAWTLPIALVMTCSLAGCQTILGQTQINETEAGIVERTCKAWLPVTYSSKDTEQTRLEARANNAAREAWGCPK